ncbi:MAG: hypothetical protein HKN82_05050, partial [Akkermansiaceae bacterium]|nr:hypothetical protein [Akkermansiaceae bacterium]
SPFDTQALVLQFDSAAIAPELAAITTATLTSTELFEPSRTYNLTGAITSFAKLLPNWNFEVGGFDTTLNTDTFAAWTEGTAPASALAVPGLIAGTSTAVRLDPGTEVAALFAAPANDFEVEFVAAYEDSGGRDFNFFVRGQDASQANIRYEGGVFSAFNSATSWEPIITVAVPASIDGNGDGDLEDGGDTKNLFRVRFTGTAWGTASPTYEVEILDAGGSLLATSGPGLAFFQNSAPTTAGVNQMVFSSEFGGIAGMWVDNVCASGSVVVPDAEIVITASSFDPVAGTGSVTFTSVDGVPYSLRASNDLNQTDLYSAPGNLIDSGPGTGTSTTFNFSDPAMVGQSFRSYRVESP